VYIHEASKKKKFVLVDVVVDIKIQVVKMGSCRKSIASKGEEGSKCFS
jgi:hypothetical protein